MPVMARLARYYPEAPQNVYTGFPQLIAGQLADHINLADGLLYPAGSLPVFRKECGGIGDDFNDITRFMGIGAAPFKKMAKFVCGDMAIPVTRSTDPDAGFRLAVGALMQDNALGV